MVRLGPLDFDDRILDSLRDRKLVVFAGAGVSKGEPSCLPLFDELADKLSGSGEKRPKGEPIDRFLGRLETAGMKVRERAVEILSNPASRFNPLHRNLNRLFGKAGNVRIVTTNFDRHFESAAADIWDEVPERFIAPALPAGDDFFGIVHIHGDNSRPAGIVLTDADFGRAYLTKGWARRFLLDLFRTFDVLFVGYSHDDPIMHYLSRSLPPEGTRCRFALTDDRSTKWDYLGIRPIRFRLARSGDPFVYLYQGVERFADHASRCLLDVKGRIEEIARRRPPKDIREATELTYYLCDPVNVRFFVRVADDSGWPAWLDGRHFLDGIYGEGRLDEASNAFADWLAESYAIRLPDVLFSLFEDRSRRPRPDFWMMLARSVGNPTDAALDSNVLSKWVPLLLSWRPKHNIGYHLGWLAERCAERELDDLLVRLFLAMCEYCPKLEKGYRSLKKAAGSPFGIELDFLVEEYSLREVWNKQVKPRLDHVHHSLLRGLVDEFCRMRTDLVAWGAAYDEWDPISQRRSAIEPHEQDRFPKTVDVLIDAARDTLEWIAEHDRRILGHWVSDLTRSGVPILRRLAIHCVGIDPGMDVDSRIAWLLENTNIYGYTEYHEIRRAMAANYSAASDAVRERVVDAILAEEVPKTGSMTVDEMTSWQHFSWLGYLLREKPDCRFAATALAPIREHFPKWTLSNHPDLSHWSGPGEWIVPTSPVSSDEMVAMDPADFFARYQDYRGDPDSTFNGPDRAGLKRALEEACAKDSFWARCFISALPARGPLGSDFLTPALTGFQKSDAGEAEWNLLLKEVEAAGVRAEWARAVAECLYSLVRDGGKPFAISVLGIADNVAALVWDAIILSNRELVDGDWLQAAINEPAGIVSEYWVEALSIAHGSPDPVGKDAAERYLARFEAAIDDGTEKGDFSRPVICSQFAFLHHLDAGWAMRRLAPLFSSKDKKRFAQAWSGFLTWGSLNSDVAAALLPSFKKACGRISLEMPTFAVSFAEFVAALSVIHLDDPVGGLLTVYFREVGPTGHASFWHKFGHIVRQFDADRISSLWEAWLRDFLNARSQGVPVASNDAELAALLEFVSDMREAFPEMVDIICRFPPAHIEHMSILHKLKEDGIVPRYPVAVAKITNYLLACRGPSYNWYGIEDILVQLNGLPQETIIELRTALARAGLDANLPIGATAADPARGDS